MVSLVRSEASIEWRCFSPASFITWVSSSHMKVLTDFQIVNLFPKSETYYCESRYCWSKSRSWFNMPFIMLINISWVVKWGLLFNSVDRQWKNVVIRDILLMLLVIAWHCFVFLVDDRLGTPFSLSSNSFSSWILVLLEDDVWVLYSSFEAVVVTILSVSYIAFCLTEVISQEKRRQKNPSRMQKSNRESCCESIE